MTQEQNVGLATRQNASLLSKPWTLYVLWEEYTKGFGEAKAAKDFTAKERGNMKHKFSRRKVFWDCVTRLLNSSLSAYVVMEEELLRKF